MKHISNLCHDTGFIEHVHFGGIKGDKQHVYFFADMEFLDEFEEFTNMVTNMDRLIIFIDKNHELFFYFMVFMHNGSGDFTNEICASDARDFDNLYEKN